MNEEQKQWVEKVEGLAIALKSGSITYEMYVGRLQDLIDTSPEP